MSRWLGPGETIAVRWLRDVRRAYVQVSGGDVKRTKPKRKLNKLHCPFCKGVWETPYKADAYEYCPLCRGQYSFAKALASPPKPQPDLAEAIYERLFVAQGDASALAVASGTCGDSKCSCWMGSPATIRAAIREVLERRS